MVDALKKLDKKFLIIAGCLIFIPIILIIFLAIIQSCSNSKMSYESYESRMIKAAEKYLKNDVPTDESEYVIIDLETLISNGYIKSYGKALKDTCTGNVTVRRNGSSIETNNGGFLNYIVNLECENYKTIHLVDKITSDVVDSESGLYLIGDEYVFRGNKVNNRINLFGQSYRIMSIDKDGIVKLIKSEPQNTSRLWDNKFNTEVNSSYGKNIYKDSAILTYLLNDYSNSKIISKKAKEHIVAYDACIGKKSQNDYSISKEKDCQEKSEKQVVSLINISDYAIASTDPECNSTNSRSCRNYNYLSNIATSTWTLNTVSENTYDVFVISDGLQKYQPANLYNEYNLVIYIDGNELYNGGTGTENNPYVIK